MTAAGGAKTWRATLAFVALGMSLRCAWAEVPVSSLQAAAARLASGGWLLMMRHAVTEPGLGDPPGYRLDDCTTQRNLSDEGRRQARETGEALRAAGIAIDEVRSSAWCRCRDTARLAFGDHQIWTPLNSFFDQRSEEQAVVREVQAAARAQDPRRNLMLVTHQVNITAVFGVFPATGEIVAGRWRDGRLTAEFRIAPLRR